MGKRLIIINRMYAGKYLTIGENIGHEVINLIRSDNGNNYLWLNADGNCDVTKFVDKKGKCRYDEIVMLMVRMYGHRQWKLLAKAQIDTSVLAEYMVPKYTEEYHNAQVKKINEEKICYGGQPINKIFDKNYFNGQLQSGIDIYFTFKASNVFLPKSVPENIEKTIINIEDLKGLANKSLRMYLTDNKNIETYYIFNDIIEGKVFEWENKNTTQKVDVNTAVIENQKEFFLKIINEEYRELTFSNLLAYFLRNKNIMTKFSKYVLGLNDFDENSYSIAREEKNIDLFVSSSNHYIIIENKIHSSLIKETKKMDKKIREYFNVDKSETLPPQASALLTAFDSAGHYYQTDRYYAYACGELFKHKSNAQICGYVLFPNYASHTISKEVTDTLFKNYRLITYLDVYDFFKNIRNNNDFLSKDECKYLDEFLWAMEKHTKSVDNSFEEEMKNRFYKKIKD